MARFPLAIKIANVLVYIFLLGANLYSGLDPNNDDSPYDGKHVTFISPAPFAFGIWGLIHFLLGGFVIYQWFGPQELVLDGINWHFVGITVWNTLWLVLWQTDHLILAWITILITSSQVTYVYAVIRRQVDASTNELVWIHAPFSLYHAWIYIITVISTFAAFSPDKTDDNVPGLFVKIFVVIALIIIQLVAVGYIFGGKGDIAGAVVIAWSLYGISVEQTDPSIHWTSLVFAVITTLLVFVPIYKKIRHRGEESAPLLG